MRAILLAAICGYQRYLSPHKGFCCAYRVHTGRSGCSALGYRAIRRYGAMSGLAVLRRRIYLCGVAHRRFTLPLQRPPRAQRGDCDPGCDFPCDFGGHASGGKSCSLGHYLSCCDVGSCDWPERKKKGKEREQGIHLPSPRKASSQRG